MPKISKQRRRSQRVRPVKTLAQFDALRPRSRITFENVAHVVTDIRNGASLTRASAEHGIDPRTVVRLGGSTLRKSKSGRYIAQRSDHLFRVLLVPVHGGRIEVGVGGSRAASVLSDRLSAQRYFLATGDDSKIRRLRGKKLLDTAGREVPFLTDLDELERLGDLGVLSFESIYARRS